MLNSNHIASEFCFKSSEITWTTRDSVRLSSKRRVVIFCFDRKRRSSGYLKTKAVTVVDLIDEIIYIDQRQILTDPHMPKQHYEYAVESKTRYLLIKLAVD